MMKTETLLWKIEATRFTKDGELSMLMNIRANHKRVSSTRSSDSMLKETSSLSQQLEINTLTFLITDIWPSRLM